MYRGVDGADSSSTVATTTTAAATSGATVLALASTSGIEVGDKVVVTSKTGASTKIASINGLNITLTVATTANISSGDTVTITPVVNVYRTIIAGKQALAEAVAQEPGVVVGPVVDKLMRYRPIGWYGVLGFSRYREAALYRIESGSSISA